MQLVIIEKDNTRHVINTTYVIKAECIRFEDYHIYKFNMIENNDIKFIDKNLLVGSNITLENYFRKPE